MARVHARNNEHFEGLMRRFKKAIEKDDTMKDMRKKDFYEKPCAVRKRKKAAAKKRWEKKSREGQLPNQNRQY